LEAASAGAAFEFLRSIVTSWVWGLSRRRRGLLGLLGRLPDHPAELAALTSPISARQPQQHLVLLVVHSQRYPYCVLSHAHQYDDD
jgi:hypothetical protein